MKQSVVVAASHLKSNFFKPIVKNELNNLFIDYNTFQIQ
jgi:hypothetical protein